MKKILGIICLSVCTIVNAGTDKAKSKIESEYDFCMKNITHGSGVAVCDADAIAEYDKLIAKINVDDDRIKAQYQAVLEACEHPYIDEGDESSFASVYVHECKLNAARYTYKTVKAVSNW